MAVQYYTNFEREFFFFTAGTIPPFFFFCIADIRALVIPTDAAAHFEHGTLIKCAIFPRSVKIARHDYRNVPACLALIVFIKIFIVQYSLGKV
jgi:hypothetical protein